MTDKYILDEQGEPIPCDDLLEWGQWFENPEKRRVARTEVGDYSVSTVFLALDHGFTMGDPLTYKPVLWETMVFDKTTGKPVGYQRRYTSREAALAGHADAVAAYLTEKA